MTARARGEAAAAAPPPARVLLSDGQERAVLAAARGLHNAGYQVAVAGSERACLTHLSRACDERLQLPSAARAPGRFAAALERVVRTGRYDALLPGSDAALRAIVQSRGQLEPHTRIGLPAPDAIIRTFDRLEIARAAEHAGLAGPPLVAAGDAEQARAAALKIGFPLLLKTRWPVVGSSSSVLKVKSRIVADERELAAVLPLFSGEGLMQALVRGQEVSCGGAMGGQGLLGLVVSRYRRTWPVVAGDVSFSTTISPPPGLADRVQELLRELGWTGIFELELISSPDGAFAAIDLNPRVYGSLALAGGAGVDLAERWCGSLLGAPLPFASGAAGIHYRREDGDLAHALWQFRHGAPRVALRALTPHRRVVHALFRGSDPGPVVARAVHFTRTRSQRAATRLAQAA